MVVLDQSKQASLFLNSMVVGKNQSEKGIFFSNRIIGSKPLPREGFESLKCKLYLCLCGSYAGAVFVWG